MTIPGEHATSETGTVGPPGPTGPMGPEGPAGDRGPKGDTGATGPKGPKGDKGDKGNTGATGATGVGATGPKGSKGDKGDAGDPGEPGPKGDTGRTGSTGMTGPMGSRGPTGASGERGLDGPPGPTKWFTGVGTPGSVDNSAGGDYYINQTDGEVWKKTAVAVVGDEMHVEGRGGDLPPYKTTLAWVDQGFTIKGSGSGGSGGSTWWVGNGDPGSPPATGPGRLGVDITTDSVVGDYYLNESNGEVWRKISDIDWQDQGFSLLGPAGAAGADGADGADGAPGARGPAGADGAAGGPGPEGPAGPLLGRKTVTFTTVGSLANMASESLDVAIDLADTLYMVQTDRAARVRTYGTSAERSADAARALNVDASTLAGCQFEAITTDSQLIIHLGPITHIANDDVSPTNIHYFNVTNLSNTTHTVTVTLILRQEE